MDRIVHPLLTFRVQARTSGWRASPPFGSPVLLIIGGPATLHKGLICAAAAQT
jgi:hypothetical protein